MYIRRLMCVLPVVASYVVMRVVIWRDIRGVFSEDLREPHRVSSH